MPELPEVEILVRHLAHLICGQRIRRVEVRRDKVLGSTSVNELKEAAEGARISELTRRAKYLLFSLTQPRSQTAIQLLGHLGMTGRMYIQPKDSPFPKHTAVIFELDRGNFIFEDTRYFGRLTLDASSLKRIGPEPLGERFTIAYFAEELKRSSQSIKVRLLDQELVAGVGNIYASESLFRAGISPRIPSRKLTRRQVQRLHQAIRETLSEAITCGSTIPLNYSGSGGADGLFYFGSAAGAERYEERLRVYGRENEPCPTCGGPVQKLVQAARSTYYCAQCQRSK